jgi:GNAT superfamily N-acetyltransferase
MADSLRCAELSPKLWPAFERLFGANGACGGCWCMAWRVPKGGRTWEEMKGENAHRAMKKLVQAGRAHGVLAFAKDEPVGWCSFGPRTHFPRLERVRAYRRSDAAEVWSINCFFIRRDFRGQGVARRLLGAVVDACRRRGAKLVEGYPVTPLRDGSRLPAAFSWMGPLRIFEERGFAVVQADPPSKPLVRLRLE